MCFPGVPSNSHQQHHWFAKSWLFSFLWQAEKAMLRGTLHLCYTLAKAALLCLSLVLSCFHHVPSVAFYNMEISTQSPSTPPARLQDEKRRKTGCSPRWTEWGTDCCGTLSCTGGRSSCFLLFLLLARILSTKLTICAGDIKFCILNADRQL